ncbi:MAG: transglutaminase-like domain-containing protein [Planctomycetota bacterium]|nr:transglutaminase-like domain-containing protein [Planctomycetota bacterium]
MAPNPTHQTPEKLPLPKMESVLLAVLAGLVVLTFRWDMHRSLLFFCCESLTYLVMPIGFFFYLRQRFQSTGESLADRKWRVGVQMGCLLFALLPIGAQVFSRQFGFGDPFEVVALVMMLNATWYLAIFSTVTSFGRVAFITGSCLVLFVCFMTQNMGSYIYAFLYLAISLWWLLGNYWDRLESKAIDGESKSLPARGFAVIVTFLFLIIVMVIAVAAGPLHEAVAMKGFMPSSGGDSWYDAYARSGIGDGDMLTSGNNATTSGAVNSEQLIEDDKPSIYDVMTDKYDSPVKKKNRRQRAQALDAVAKHIHNIKQSEQSGRSFRTVRERVEEEKPELEDRITKALFFVEGQVPARFGVDSFYHFDGWDWSKPKMDENELNKPVISVQRKGGKPWFVIGSARREFLTASQAHRIKIMRLDTKAIPAPPLLKSWHIDKVDLLNLFRWDEQGSVVIDGDGIATQTVIDVVSEIPNYYLLRSGPNLTTRATPKFETNWFDRWFGASTPARVDEQAANGLETDPDSLLIQVPDNPTTEILKQKVSDLTRGIPAGWQQVDAIVDHLRTGYQHDEQRRASPDCDDAIASFLEQQGGPSYLFATTAAQMLRVAGYRTRLRSGFLVRREDYDRIARQSIVDSSNLHMWPEVSIDGWNWLPVEPTPGYPIPANTQTLMQWFKVRLAAAGNWILSHPFLSILAVLFISGVVRYRKLIVMAIGWLVWKLSMIGLPGMRLRLTRKLLDLRFWAAGVPRPSSVPITDWYSQVDPTAGTPFIEHWNQANFSSKPISARQSQVSKACNQAIHLLTYRRIRKFANQT